MKRPHSHVTGEKAIRLVQESLPESWIVRELPRDYGVDLEVEIVDHDTVTGRRFWIQVKGSEAALPTRVSDVLVVPYAPLSGPGAQAQPREVKVRAVPFRVDVKLLLYALSCPFPLLLFVRDLATQAVYWLPLRDHLEVSACRPNPGWEKQTSVTVSIPEWNTLAHERSRAYKGLRWYALEPARMYNLVKISHLVADLRRWDTATEGLAIGTDGITLGAKCDDPRGLVLASLRASLQKLTQVLALSTVFRDSHPEIGSAGTEVIAKGCLSAQEAIQLLALGSYQPQELGSLLGDVSHARRFAGNLAQLLEYGRSLFVLSSSSASEALKASASMTRLAP